MFIYLSSPYLFFCFLRFCVCCGLADAIVEASNGCRWIRKQLDDYVPWVAAHPELQVSHGRFCKLLSYPMKCKAMWTQRVHETQEMPTNWINVGFSGSHIGCWQMWCLLQLLATKIRQTLTLSNTHVQSSLVSPLLSLCNCSSQKFSSFRQWPQSITLLTIPEFLSRLVHLYLCIAHGLFSAWWSLPWRKYAKHMWLPLDDFEGNEGYRVTLNTDTLQNIMEDIRLIIGNAEKNSPWNLKEMLMVDDHLNQRPLTMITWWSPSDLAKHMASCAPV